MAQDSTAILCILVVVLMIGALLVGIELGMSGRIVRVNRVEESTSRRVERTKRKADKLFVRAERLMERAAVDQKLDQDSPDELS